MKEYLKTAVICAGTTAVVTCILAATGVDMSGNGVAFGRWNVLKVTHFIDFASVGIIVPILIMTKRLTKTDIEPDMNDHLVGTATSIFLFGFSLTIVGPGLSDGTGLLLLFMSTVLLPRSQTGHFLYAPTVFWCAFTGIAFNGVVALAFVIAVITFKASLWWLTDTLRAGIAANRSMMETSARSADSGREADLQPLAKKLWETHRDD